MPKRKNQTNPYIRRISKNTVVVYNTFRLNHFLDHTQYVISIEGGLISVHGYQKNQKLKPIVYMHKSDFVNQDRKEFEPFHLKKTQIQKAIEQAYQEISYQFKHNSKAL